MCEICHFTLDHHERILARGVGVQIADTWDSMDAWVDAVRLVYTIYAKGKRDVLANVLVV